MLKLRISNFKKAIPLGPAKGAKPLPFHGKFPTKIAIDVRWGRRPDQRWTYIGVPSIYAIHALNKRMRFRGAAAKYWEFDRKGQLLYAHCQPGANRLRVQNHNNTLVAIYHHWNNMADPFLGFTAQFWMKKVQGRWIYSPFEHLKLDTHLRPYKAWLAEALETKPKVLKPEGYRFTAQYVAPINNDWLRQVNANPAELRAQVVEAVAPPPTMQQLREARLREMQRADHARRLARIHGFPE